MRYRNFLALACAMLILAAPLTARRPRSPQRPGQKDYLTEAEADKIRDADTPAERIKIYVGFAEDRLKKFEYELHRKVPEAAAPKFSMPCSTAIPAASTTPRTRST